MVTLLLLLVVTLIGLAAIRGALLQERMAANAYARAVAFEIGEGALRQAEGFAAGKPAAPSSGCGGGVCVLASGATPAWQSNAAFWKGNNGWATTTPIALPDGDSDVTPQYVIEKFGTAEAPCATQAVDMSADECKPTLDVYRITVRTEIPGDGAEVILQSLYQVP